MQLSSRINFRSTALARPSRLKFYWTRRGFRAQGLGHDSKVKGAGFRLDGLGLQVLKGLLAIAWLRSLYKGFKWSWGFRVLKIASSGFEASPRPDVYSCAGPTWRMQHVSMFLITAAALAYEKFLIVVDYNWEDFRSFADGR